MPRPRVCQGQYYKTRGGMTKIRCKAYTAPPGSGGTYITSIDASTYLGPVEAWLDIVEYTTILVREYWINIWAADHNCHFATKVPSREIRSWMTRGWYHA